MASAEEEALGISLEEAERWAGTEHDGLKTAYINWLSEQSQDVWMFFLRQFVNVGEPHSASYETCLWMVDQSELCKANASLLFWKLQETYPYFSSNPADFADRRERFPGLEEALNTLIARWNKNDFAKSKLGVTKARLWEQMFHWEKRMVEADKRGWTKENWPFEIPSSLRKQVNGLQPVLPDQIPKPKDKRDAAVWLMEGGIMPNRFSSEIAKEKTLIRKYAWDNIVIAFLIVLLILALIGYLWSKGMFR